MTRKIFGICILIGCIVLSFRESCSAPTCPENAVKGCSSKEREGLLAYNRGIRMQICQRNSTRNKGWTWLSSVLHFDSLSITTPRSATQK